MLLLREKIEASWPYRRFYKNESEIPSLQWAQPILPAPALSNAPHDDVSNGSFGHRRRDACAAFAVLEYGAVVQGK